MYAMLGSCQTCLIKFANCLRPACLRPRCSATESRLDKGPNSSRASMHYADKASLIGRAVPAARQTERVSRTESSRNMSHICQILLERPNGPYYAGETVNGHIYLTLPERALIKAVSLESNGYACTSWSVPKSTKKGQAAPAGGMQPHVTFGQRVDYFAKVDYFVGSEAALPQLLAAGAYRYDFSVQLPPSCPSSYEGAHGHIRYELKLHVEHSAHQPSEPSLVHRLQVLQRGEPGQEQPPLLEQPCELTAVEQTPALKFWQRALQLQVNVPRGSYEPGQGISVHVRMHNAQELPLLSISYKLNQVSTYMGYQQQASKRQPSKVLRQQVDRRQLLGNSYQLNSCSRHELLNFQHLHTLYVPQMVPPTLESRVCACLHVGYELEVLVQTKTPHRFVSARMPIVVREPLRPHTELALAQPMGLPSAPNRTPEPNSFATGAPTLSSSLCSLATQFREAEFMMATNLNKDKHAMSGDQLDFRPRYLYYEMDHVETEKVL